MSALFWSVIYFLPEDYLVLEKHFKEMEAIWAQDAQPAVGSKCQISLEFRETTLLDPETRIKVHSSILDLDRHNSFLSDWRELAELIVWKYRVFIEGASEVFEQGKAHFSVPIEAFAFDL